jgi:hypothetical protein
MCCAVYLFMHCKLVLVLAAQERIAVATAGQLILVGV